MMGTWDVEIHYLLGFYVSFLILSTDVVGFTTKGSLVLPDRPLGDEIRKSLNLEPPKVLWPIVYDEATSNYGLD